MSSQRDTIIHLVAGGIAGTAGAVVTCPLEVVKTRLQSSNPVFGKEQTNSSRNHKLLSGNQNGISSRYTSKTSRSLPPITPPKLQPRNGFNSGQKSPFSTCASCGRSAQILAVPHHSQPVTTSTTPKIGLSQCLRLIIEKEGARALFKGLGPNLVGVAPSRAIYFCSYSQSKKTFNQMLPADSPVVHLCSAATAGFVACTATNPVWFVKTRLQLDQEKGLSARQTVHRIYAQGGLLGFYKGISASYMGISETVIHFVIYEAVKKRLQEWSHSSRTLADEDYNSEDKTSRDFFQFMAAGAFSKTVASCIAYPHEVARTRLREEGNKYHHLVQTLVLVAKEEGWRGLYRGLATQLIRQIPNTAIMMSTYEAAVYLLNKYTNKPSDSDAEDDSLTTVLTRREDFDESFYAECAAAAAVNTDDRRHSHA